MVWPALIAAGAQLLGGGLSARDAAKSARTARRYQEAQQRSALGQLDVAAGRYQNAPDPFSDLELQAMQADAARNLGQRYGGLASDVRGQYARRGIFQSGGAIGQEAAVRGAGFQAAGLADRDLVLAQMAARREQELANRQALAGIDMARANVYMGAPPPAQADYSGASRLFASGAGTLAREFSPDTANRRAIEQEQLRGLRLANSSPDERRISRYSATPKQRLGGGVDLFGDGGWG